MIDQFSRTRLLIGEDALNKLKNSTVAVFGIGGVGSYTVEALARSGVGNLVLVDRDDISITNVNRQIHSTIKTVGQPKVEVMKDRVLSINPDINVKIYKEFYMPDNSDFMIDKNYSYIVDAVDTVTAKIDLVEKQSAARIGNASNVRCEIRYGKDDSLFQLVEVQVDYVKVPQHIRLTQEQIDLTEDTSQIMEFPDYVNQEIINELVHLVMLRTNDPQLGNHMQMTQTIARPTGQQQQQTAAQG